jgi:hypothetical protein
VGTLTNNFLYQYNNNKATKIYGGFVLKYVHLIKRVFQNAFWKLRQHVDLPLLDGLLQLALQKQLLHLRLLHDVLVRLCDAWQLLRDALLLLRGVCVS